MSAEPDTFQTVKALLQKSKQVGAIKVDLFGHITEIINRILAHHKYDAYQKFEEISYLIKKTQLKVKNPKPMDQVKELNADQTQLELDRYVDEVRSLLYNKISVPSYYKHLVKKSYQCAVGDFLEQSQMLDWAGISFGESETYRIQKSMQRLAHLSGASCLRFWGKILASKHDYYVIEGQVNDAGEPEIPHNCEKRGEGVNKYVYWVTDNILADWIQLAEVDPVHIKAARKFKHIMTGDLNADVLTCPPFPGKERHYLRAQIARIAHATTLHPKGLLELDEDNPNNLKYAEEFTMPPTAELNSTEIWGHHYPNILDAGRISH